MVIPLRLKRASLLLCGVGVVGVLHAGGAASPQNDTGGSGSQRLQALEREAKELASREKTLLAELRRLEIQRQIRAEELEGIEREREKTTQALAAATTRQAELRAAAEAFRPEIEQRLVRLYKMGRAGHWRLLLDVDDARSVGRAYRTAAALSQLDHDTVKQHEATLKALEKERATLEARAREMAALQRKATAARAAADRAIASQKALLESVTARQDLAAQLAAELRAAQVQLDGAVNTAVEPGGAPGAAVPLAAVKGSLPWPAEGIVIGRFGRPGPRGTGARNGIELSLAEGRPVAAVHDGVVTHASPFAGYGQLVIVAHGASAHSLYGHLRALSVIKGDRVKAGAQLGRSGRNLAGNPALYFELRIDGKPVDPLQWLRRRP